MGCQSVIRSVYCRCIYPRKPLSSIFCNSSVCTAFICRIEGLGSIIIKVQTRGQLQTNSEQYKSRQSNSNKHNGISIKGAHSSLEDWRISRLTWCGFMQLAAANAGGGAPGAPPAGAAPPQSTYPGQQQQSAAPPQQGRPTSGQYGGAQQSSYPGQQAPGQYGQPPQQQQQVRSFTSIKSMHSN